MDSIDLTRRRLAMLCGMAGVLAACGGGSSSPSPAPAPFTPSPAPPGAGPATTDTFRSGLTNPWGMAFLPDGRILVTERGGSMRIVSADGSNLGAPIDNVPAVHAAGQGGLLDVAIDPDFATQPWVYFSFSEDGSGGSGTAVGRGQLSGNALTNVQVIFQQSPKVGGDGHYGSRLVFAADKTLWITLGERQTDDPAAPTNANAQNLGKHLGKVVRINRDGSVPGDNPFVNTAGALPQIYSYGHRNPQGAALHPLTGELWLNEHGPQGGDEINRVLPGRNYGWPLRSYGCPYGSPVGPACQVNGGTHAPDYEEPLATWVPTSTAPSGMMFYTGSGFPEWQGSLFVGALAGTGIWRFPVTGNTLGNREQLFTSLGRIRDVRQGPDGWIYLLTDSASGRIVRVQR
jgi:glucose/arabinose dehydrogenase